MTNQALKTSMNKLSIKNYKTVQSAQSIIFLFNFNREISVNDQFLIFCHVSIAKRHHFIGRILHGNHFKGCCVISKTTFSYEKYHSYGKQKDNESNAHQYNNRNGVRTGFHYLIYKKE